MEYHVLLVVFAWCSFGFVADIAEGVYITCKQGFVDIRENASTTITCYDVYGDTLKWWMTRPGATSSELVASCTSANCTVHSSGQYEVNQDMSSWKSELVYHQQDRAQDLNANVMCGSTTHSGNWTTDSCTMNVISPAILSDCVVEEDRNKGETNGTCNFERAFSTNTSFDCKWHLTWTPSQATTYDDGIITNKEEYRLNGLVYYRGQCTLSFPRRIRGIYSYSIDFYPGSGPVSVPIRRLVSQSTVPPSTSQQPIPATAEVSESTVPPSTSQQAIPSTAEVTRRPSASPSTQPISIAPEGEHSSNESGDDSPPIAAIASGAGAAVVVVSGAVVITVFVTRLKRRRQRPADLQKAPADDDCWEEHISGNNHQNPGRHQAPASHNIDTNVAEGVYEITDNGQPCGRPSQPDGQLTGENSDEYQIPDSPHDHQVWQEHVSGDDLRNPGRHEMLASHNIDTNVGDRLDASARGVYEIMDNPDTSSSWEAAESGVDGQPSGRPPQAIGQPTQEISDGYEIPVSPQGQQRTNTTGAHNTPSVTVTSSSPTGDNSHGNYASLQMSDVGLPSVYTCLADPDYYNTGAAGVTGPDAETSPEYEN